MHEPVYLLSILLLVCCTRFSLATGITGLIDLEIYLIEFTNPGGLAINGKHCKTAKTCDVRSYGFKYCIEDDSSGISETDSSCNTGWNDVGYISTVNYTIHFTEASGNWRNPLKIRLANLKFYQLKLHFYQCEYTAGVCSAFDVTYISLSVDQNSTALGTLAANNLKAPQIPNNATLNLNVTLTCAYIIPQDTATSNTINELYNNTCHAAPSYHGPSVFDLYLGIYNNSAGILATGAPCTCSLGFNVCYETYDRNMTLSNTLCTGTQNSTGSLTTTYIPPKIVPNYIDFNSTESYCNARPCSIFQHQVHYDSTNFTALRVKITILNYPELSPVDYFVFDVWALDLPIGQSKMFNLQGLRATKPSNLTLEVATSCPGYIDSNNSYICFASTVAPTTLSYVKGGEIYMTNDLSDNDMATFRNNIYNTLCGLATFSSACPSGYLARFLVSATNFSISIAPPDQYCAKDTTTTVIYGYVISVVDSNGKQIPDLQVKMEEGLSNLPLSVLTEKLSVGLAEQLQIVLPDSAEHDYAICTTTVAPGTTTWWERHWYVIFFMSISFLIIGLCFARFAYKIRLDKKVEGTFKKVAQMRKTFDIETAKPLPTPATTQPNRYESECSVARKASSIHSSEMSVEVLQKPRRNAPRKKLSYVGAEKESVTSITHADSDTYKIIQDNLTEENNEEALQNASNGSDVIQPINSDEHDVIPDVTVVTIEQEPPRSSSSESSWSVVDERPVRNEESPVDIEATSKFIDEQTPELAVSHMNGTAITPESDNTVFDTGDYNESLYAAIEDAIQPIEGGIEPITESQLPPQEIQQFNIDQAATTNENVHMPNEDTSEVVYQVIRKPTKPDRKSKTLPPPLPPKPDFLTPQPPDLLDKSQPVDTLLPVVTAGSPNDGHSVSRKKRRAPPPPLPTTAPPCPAGSLEENGLPDNENTDIPLREPSIREETPDSGFVPSPLPFVVNDAAKDNDDPDETAERPRRFSEEDWTPVGDLDTML